MLLSVVLVSRAQSKSLELYYIAHDHYETVLSGIIEAVHSYVRDNPDRKVVFYLSNGNSPKYLLASKNDSESFAAFINELKSSTSHLVAPNKDRDALLSFMSSGDVLPANGLEGFDKVVLNFFISQNFVMKEYGDALIGRLFWDMELAQLPDGKLEVNILCPKEEKIDVSQMFGRMNLMNKFPISVNVY